MRAKKIVYIKQRVCLHFALCKPKAVTHFKCWLLNTKMACGYHYCLTLLLLVAVLGSSNAQLSTNFYSNSCPNLLSTVKSTVNSAINKEARMGASIGCDGSILLDDTSSFTGEKNANPNRNSARGFDVVDNIKSAVENVCPGVVSCADILAIAARDSVEILGGPSWNVKLGRRDARTASQSAANNGIPAPTSNLNQLISRFSALGLSSRDLCQACRVSHNWTSKVHIIQGSHIQREQHWRFLRSNKAKKLPKSNGLRGQQFGTLDVQTPTSFDNNYFKNLVNNRGLLHSDQQLFNGGSTDSIVSGYGNNPTSFNSDFASAMIKMGDISPLTGSSGEIRKNCRSVN
ncbi:hypothetical protein V6N13_034153 [Hibiscus sabdariffa]